MAGTTWLAALALVAGLVGCASDGGTREASTAPAVGSEPTDSPATTDGEQVAVPAGLTEGDVEGLLWMREEEQLAHDVYTVLGEEWGLRIFANIAAAEQRHVERVVGLLDSYGIEDPMAGRSEGSFTIPEIQHLYDQLVVDGGESTVAALEVGALIEETDIVDLRTRASDVADIQTAYSQLEEGSQQHLRAFVRQLDSRGAGYDPVVLDPAAYAEIVSGR